ncbi:MAG: phage/plasmid primase, P4 family [Candidatus Tectomicrobia bacterium]
MPCFDFDRVELSVFQNAHATTPRSKPATVTQFLDAIEQERDAKVINQVRDLRAKYKAGKIDKSVYQEFKARHLEAVTLAGTFAPERKAKSLQKHSGLVIGDIDDLDDPEAVRERLKDDLHIAFSFLSPGGDGLKLATRVLPQSDAAGHKKAWHAWADYLGAKYGVPLDSSGSDVNRLCYVSVDPLVYRNPEAIPLPIPKQEERPLKRYKTGKKPGDALNAVADRTWWQKLLERHGWTYSHDDTSDSGIAYWTRPGKDSGVSASLGYQPDGGKGELWLYVWSDHAAPLTPGWHHPFKAYALLEHGGDFSAAAQELSEQGYGMQKQPNTMPPGSKRELPNTPLSDVVNAEELVEHHGEDLYYCHPWGKWLIWTGTHWRIDDTGEVMRRCIATVKDMMRRATYVEDEGVFASMMAHAKASLASAKLKAMATVAQSEPGIPILPDALDADPWLLYCLNGTLDLRTGSLRDHQRGDVITKVIPVAYDPNAQCPTWHRFLWRIMGGTIEVDSPDDSAAILEARRQSDEKAKGLIAFLQRAMGYALTGDTREECLFILYGSGQNGKSKLVGALQDLLGSYAQSTHSKTFMVSDRADGIPNDLARLHGARVVTAIELGKGRRLNEELVKRVTGRDLVTARFLYGEFFDFLPQFKLFLVCNNLPNVSSVDKAMWRRIHQVPFTITIPDEERDEALGEKLRAELPGILAWAVNGCLTWQHHGLRPPTAVTQATETYKAEMDVVGRFIEDCCIVAAQCQTKATPLYKAYTTWCEDIGERAESQTEFGKSLENRGFTKHISGGVWRVGIGIRHEQSG